LVEYKTNSIQAIIYFGIINSDHKKGKLMKKINRIIICLISLLLNGSVYSMDSSKLLLGAVKHSISAGLGASVTYWYCNEEATRQQNELHNKVTTLEKTNSDLEEKLTRSSSGSSVWSNNSNSGHIAQTHWIEQESKYKFQILASETSIKKLELDLKESKSLLENQLSESQVAYDELKVEFDSLCIQYCQNQQTILELSKRALTVAAFDDTCRPFIRAKLEKWYKNIQDLKLEQNSNQQELVNIQYDVLEKMTEAKKFKSAEKRLAKRMRKRSNSTDSTKENGYKSNGSRTGSHHSSNDSILSALSDDLEDYENGNLDN